MFPLLKHSNWNVNVTQVSLKKTMPQLQSKEKTEI